MKRFMFHAFLIVLCFANCLCKDNSFVERHWNHPIEIQGPPPANSNSIESKLTPENCGACHSEQFSYWKKSMHRESMSQGLLWQLPGLGEKQSDSCLHCHSPLMETRLLVKQNLGWGKQYPENMNLYFPTDTKEHGISCASCHVRKHVRFGPPPKKGTQHITSAHQSFQIQKEFESSTFCKNCHESKSDSNRVNDKRMMETYSEWEASDFRRKGIECQSCHMPNRKHEWKGIHNKEMVLSGIEKDVKFKRVGSELEISASLHSVNIGHKFPTYAVPKIDLKLSMQGKEIGKRMIGDFTIGRLIDIHLTNEFYDTRLDPGKMITISARIAASEMKKFDSVIFEADVQPDELYERMFSFNIENKDRLGHSLVSLSKIREALRQKQNSKYKLFILNLPMPDQLPE